MYALLIHAKDGQWYVAVRSGNHRVVSVTETYKRRISAINAALKMGLPVMEHDEHGRLTTVAYADGKMGR